MKLIFEVVKLNKNYPYYSHEKMIDLRQLLETNLKLAKDEIAFIYKDPSLKTISKTNKIIYIKNILVNISRLLPKTVIIG